MIAANYRKFPEAMALQLVLVFGRPVWNTARPSTRIGRALRCAQAALVKATPQLVRWISKPNPAWYIAARKAARDLAKQVRQALESLVWDQDADAPEEAPNAIAELMATAAKMPRPQLSNPCLLSGAISHPNLHHWYHASGGSFNMRHNGYRNQVDGCA